MHAGAALNPTTARRALFLPHYLLNQPPPPPRMWEPMLNNCNGIAHTQQLQRKRAYSTIATETSTVRHQGNQTRHFRHLHPRIRLPTLHASLHLQYSGWLMVRVRVRVRFHASLHLHLQYSGW
jgi:hypothetical protein